MRMRFLLSFVVATPVICALGCGGGSTEPRGGRPDPVLVQGVVEVPWDSSEVAPPDLEVTFADRTIPVSEDGTFELAVYPDGPGLLMAADEAGTAVLLSVVSGVGDGETVHLDARTTALALVFLHPGITTSDPEDAAAVLSRLESLGPFQTFQDRLEAGLAVEPAVLAVEDEDLNQAWWDVIDAYFGAMLEGSGGEEEPGSLLAPQGEIIIDPSYEKGGHRINALGGSEFEVTNANGRWALFVPPNAEDAFWVFPNGTLIDWLIKERPFPPSKRKFQLTVALADAEKVNIYGIGLSPDADNLWGSLSEEEQSLAIEAGVATALLEFVPHVLSTVGNSGRVVESLKVDNNVFVAVRLILKNARIVDRVREYIRAENIGGMYWFLTKEILSEISTNAELRASLAGLLGVVITDSVVSRTASVVNTKLVHPVLLGNAYTSVLKTVLGVGSSRYKTTFTISNVVDDFGNVTGTVHDEESGLPIEGATVELLGEVENPLEPDLTDITTSSGGYFFENITTGLKSVRASKEGYLPAAVDVTVRADKTVTAPLIELARPSGSASGTIRNRILTDHGIPDDRFRGAVEVEARQIGGGTQVFFSPVGGDFEVNLSPGTFWLVARHEDYFPDSVEVTVRAGSRSTAPRDLVMKPKGRLEGEVLIDMDGNGQFESRFDIVQGVAWIMDPAQTGGTALILSGTTGSVTTYDSFTLMFDAGLVQGPDVYDLGGLDGVGDGGAAAAALYVTTRSMCQPPVGPSQPMTFATLDFGDDPAQAVCGCGVGFKGTVIVEEWGSALTEAVDAEIFGGELVGYRNCECICCSDTDGDGRQDDYVAQCARARLNLRFRALVGSLPQGGP